MEISIRKDNLHSVILYSLCPGLTKIIYLTKPSERSIDCYYVQLYKSSSGGYIDEHLYVSGHDRDDNIRTAVILADKGYAVQLLPDLYSCESELREEYLFDVHQFKNPDARINGQWIADFKKPAKSIPIKKSTISRLIESAAQQKAAIAVLNLSGQEYAIQDIKKGIIGALQPDRNRSIQEVWIITQNKNLFIASRLNVYNEAIYLELDNL
ncbi:MAG: hypothetical protein J7578_12090 [Chitinophagaceae bacterium]|nr:hypothetical protein [Chitinophagaceae bacterium]